MPTCGEPAVSMMAGPSFSGKNDRDKFVLERRTRNPKRAGLWVIRQVPNNNMIIPANRPQSSSRGLALANIVPPVQMKAADRRGMLITGRPDTTPSAVRACSDRACRLGTLREPIPTVIIGEPVLS
jgi:hypothetical protein